MTLLSEHTTTTAADALADAEVGLLPTGSTEQHGPALPLSTDFTTAEALARSLDRDDAVVLPTVPVGVSEHHRQFDGTLYVDPETFEWYVQETLASLAEHGVRKAVVVNGHGGNTGALQRAARSLRRDGVAFAAPWSWWEAVPDVVEDEFGETGGHADAAESSVMLHLAGEHVREDALEEAEAGASDSWGLSVQGAEIGFDTADFSESGAVGTPTDASAAAGERIVDAASDRLDALVDWLADQRLEDLQPEPHR
jgi:creatinine amidohydrolase